MDDLDVEMLQCMAIPPASSTQLRWVQQLLLSHPDGGPEAHCHLFPVQFCVVRCSLMTRSSPLRVLAASCPATVVPSVAISFLLKSWLSTMFLAAILPLAWGSMVPSMVTSTFIFRVDVGMEMARALTPPL